MEIYNAIAAVSGELAQRGISKDSRNAAQGFNFRGIDAVYNALAPLLAKHKLVILPRCIERTCVERTNSKGTALFYVTIKAEFDLVASDGSKHTVATYGEAMDSGDKATNKAMSAAYKYAAFQAFCIPTEETATDADSETHEVQSVDLTVLTADMDAATNEAELKAAFAAAWKASKGNATIKAHYEKLKTQGVAA